MKRNQTRPLLIILSVSILLRLFLFFFFPVSQWWDSGVYAGMGKFIYSFGSQGLWEHIRPPFFPLVLGFFWFLGFDMVFSAFLLELLFSTGCIILSYFIAKSLFNDQVAFLSSSFISFSPIFFFMGFQTYSEIPALFFVLFAFFLLLKNYFLVSGFMLGLAFLTRFPAGLFLPLLISYLVCSKKIYQSMKVLAGFILSTSPFFLANYLLFHNPFQPLIDANILINQVLGCNVLNAKPWYYYISSLLVKENFLNFFFIIGFIVALFDFKKFALIILSFSAPFVYFLSINCKDYRYVILFLPFFLFFVAFGVYTSLASRKLLLVFVLYMIVALSLSLYFYFLSSSSDINSDYISYLKNKPVSGEIWSSDPLISFFTDSKINKIYYPLYNSDLASQFYIYLVKNKSEIHYIFLDNCGGGIMCLSNDDLCQSKSEEIFSFLDANLDLVFNRSKGICWYKIYENSNHQPVTGN